MFRYYWPVLMIGFLVTVVQGADPRQHEGLEVSAGGGKLVMTDTAGKQHTHTIPEAAKITVNGKPAKLTDLKAGVRIRVMSDAAGVVMSVATVDDAKLTLKFIPHVAAQHSPSRTILAN